MAMSVLCHCLMISHFTPFFMIRVALWALLLVLPLSGVLYGQSTTPKPVGPVPNANQLRWQKLEYYAFVHFSTNTYTNQEWGFGDDDPSIFNPTSLDCRQWARVCKEAGMKGIIITAKHHSGFCLWPSRYTEYSIKHSPWKNGQGDIVGDLAKACKEYGLKLGIYLSPWDRNSADYGRPEYITYFRNQLRELLTNYGDIFEIWFDGANGGSGYYGGARETRKIDRTTYYDWKNTYKLIRELQPNIVIWNDGGDRADLRWVGTEAGYVGETNWSLLNATGDVPEEMLRHGVENGDSWVPGEVNTSIRPGWFYHAYEDGKVKTLPQLMDIYYQSIGRNGTLLLNFPIDRRGLIHEQDAAVSSQLAAAVKEAFAINLASQKPATASNVRKGGTTYAATNATDHRTDSYWATDDGVKTASLTIDLGKPTLINRFLVQEYIPLGQRVKAFTVDAQMDGQWKQLAQETTIGYKRILRFPTVKATRVRLSITAAKASPLISNIGIYNAPQLLTAPGITRQASGEIVLSATDTESKLYYTLDGSTPTLQSGQYTGPVSTTGKVVVKAIAYDATTGKSSPVREESFDIDHRHWQLLGQDTEKATALIDGNPATNWHQPKGKELPADILIDLGKTETLSGFRYLPDQNWWGGGLISTYQFFVSPDNIQWQLVDEGEFANIQNNPLWQVKSFAPQKARYIKLRAIKTTKPGEAAGYAELDVITP